MEGKGVEKMQVYALVITSENTIEFVPAKIETQNNQQMLRTKFFLMPIPNNIKPVILKKRKLMGEQAYLVYILTPIAPVNINKIELKKKQDLSKLGIRFGFISLPDAVENDLITFKLKDERLSAEIVKKMYDSKVLSDFLEFAKKDVGGSNIGGAILWLILIGAGLFLLMKFGMPSLAGALHGLGI